VEVVGDPPAEDTTVLSSLGRGQRFSSYSLHEGGSSAAKPQSEVLRIVKVEQAVADVSDMGAAEATGKATSDDGLPGRERGGEQSPMVRRILVFVDA
jgi:hypothetical protein